VYNYSENCLKENKFPAKQNVVYIIRTSKKLDIEKIITKFKDIKEEDNTKEPRYRRGMSRINNQHKENHKCLYVGSSQDIEKRLKNHLDLDNSKSTYALHLKQWHEYCNNIEIEIFIFSENNSENVQLFEDLLWCKYKPLFGRQGKK